MKEQVTITRHEMAQKCSEALNIMLPDENRSVLEVSKLLFFAGMIISIMFNEEEDESDENLRFQG